MSVTHRTRILVIRDDVSMSGWLGPLADHADYEVCLLGPGERSDEALAAWPADAAVIDLEVADPDPIGLVGRFAALQPETDVIVLVSKGDTPRAVAAVRAGASYFLEKPAETEGILALIGRAASHKDLQAENARLRKRLEGEAGAAAIVGRSRVMASVLDLVATVASSEANILIQGENGTGKELVANAIHGASRRSRGPFVKINCAAIPRDLIESELFGYRRGSFTGATSDREGLFAAADGGSLLLDEIGEMPSYLQTKLLRVLQEREYRPIGGERQVRTDFRLICATNVDIDTALAEGRIREDLFFRINTITVRVPPLRERPEDIPLLAEHFVERFSRLYERPVRMISAAALDLLTRARWPGNVRELENAIERAVLVAGGQAIEPGDLPESLAEARREADGFTVPVGWTLADVERMTILQTLERAGWNKQEAAARLGLYRPTLYSKMKKHGIGRRPNQPGPERAAGPGGAAKAPGTS